MACWHGIIRLKGRCGAGAPVRERLAAKIRRGCSNRHSLVVCSSLIGKGHAAFATWRLFMPATTYSPTHFRAQPGSPSRPFLARWGGSTIGPAGLNLRRFAGVSEAGARSRNPERSVRGISDSWKSPWSRVGRCLIGKGACNLCWAEIIDCWPKSSWPLWPSSYHCSHSAKKIMRQVSARLMSRKSERQ